MLKLLYHIFAKLLEKISIYDTETQKIVKRLPDNFTFSIEIFDLKLGFRFRIKNDRIEFLGKSKGDEQLRLILKNQTIAKRLFWSRETIATAYAKHQIALFGNPYYAMLLTHIINRVVWLLYPKFYLKSVFTRIPTISFSQRLSAIRAFISTIF